MNRTLSAAHSRPGRITGTATLTSSLNGPRSRDHHGVTVSLTSPSMSAAIQIAGTRRARPPLVRSAPIGASRLSRSGSGQNARYARPAAEPSSGREVRPTGAWRPAASCGRWSRAPACRCRTTSPSDTGQRMSPASSYDAGLRDSRHPGLVLESAAQGAHAAGHPIAVVEASRNAKPASHRVSRIR